MKRNSIFLFAVMAATAISMSSCSSEEMPDTNQQVSPAELRITAIMAPTLEVSTRATHNLQGTSIYNNDFTKIGMYVWKTGETEATTSAPVYSGYQNVQMSAGTPDASATYYTITKSGTSFYFPVDNSAVDVYLYAPWNNTAAGANMVSPSFTVQDDQSTDDNYVASDFIYGKATASYTGTNAKTAEVTMYHALSKIIFKVVPASGVTFSSFTELKLTGVNRTTQVRMANAPSSSMTVGNNTTDHVAIATAASSTDVIVTNYSNFVAPDAANDGVAAIIPPQSLTSLGVSCTIDGKTATANLSGLQYDNSGTPTTISDFQPGKVYTITLNVKTGALDVRLIAIHDWDSGNGDGSSLDLTF